MPVSGLEHIIPIRLHNACLLYTSVFRPERLCDLLYAMRGNGIEPKRLRFVQPRADQAPVLVLAEGIKGAKAKLITQAPLLINGNGERYSEQMKRIYQGEML